MYVPYVPIHACGCCEDPFTIFILSIIVMFVIFLGVVKPIADACHQEDEKEKAEYRKLDNASIDYPGKPWTGLSRARVQTRLIIEEKSDGYHLVWRNDNTKKKP